MIQPSALNVIIIGLSMIIFTLMFRMIASRLSEKDNPLGGAMAAAL